MFFEQPFNGFGQIIVTKHNENKMTEKLRVDLIAPEMIEALAEVMGKAAESGKYQERSWETDPTYTYMKHIASILRHTLAVMKGEDIDDDGLLHSDHIACRGAMLATMQRRKKVELDDRPACKKSEVKSRAEYDYLTAANGYPEFPE